MLCSRANSVDEICLAYRKDFSGSVDSGLCLEVKYDGERVQVALTVAFISCFSCTNLVQNIVSGHAVAANGA